jgi:2-succinyl-5-enolpyruvyl-6-hydroxy-3-cyclohexene-1-carboxylate synthase
VSATTPADVAATFCATLVDEWVRGGVTRAVVCPGSRSTPLALALAAQPAIEVSVHHDERSAGFVAVGIGLATGRPAIVLTTSGTAAVELHASVVEAHQAGVPMIVCTADRPPELHHVGASQTIDQQRLFGNAVRWFVDAGVPDDAARGAWRSLASRALLAATSAPPGPVQVNLPFREPLLGRVGELPASRADGGPWHRTVAAKPGIVRGSDDVSRVAALVSGRRGVVVAGRGVDDVDAVVALAERLGWPVLGEPRAGLAAGPPVVARADALLRSPGIADELRPEVVLRVGEPPASKVVNQWLATASEQIVVDAWQRGIDPDRRTVLEVASSVGSLARALAALEDIVSAPAAWAARWAAIEAAAERVLVDALDGDRDAGEAQVARITTACAPAGAALVVSSSMPVRDVEWYGVRRRDVGVFANRGANGIDGVVSTALGIALTGRPTIALVGDLAFVHDSSALVALAQRSVPLTVVVVDNDGGGIFSFLGQADALDHAQFEQLFGTPHGTDIAALARAHRLEVHEPSTAAELRAVVRASAGVARVRVVVLRSDRATNVVAHRSLHAAVAEAIEAL